MVIAIIHIILPLVSFGLLFGSVTSLCKKPSYCTVILERYRIIFLIFSVLNVNLNDLLGQDYISNIINFCCE
jgi:hypothetical protein